MTWTKTVPTKAGRYWWRCNDGNEPTLITLYDRAYPRGQFGEWWPVPFLFPWESQPESVNERWLTTRAEAFVAFRERCDTSDGFRPCAESFENGWDSAIHSPAESRTQKLPE